MTRIVGTPRRYATAVVAAAALVGIGLVAAPPSNAGTALTGTFSITAGSCSGGVHGSYFRMIMHGGTMSGPFLSNSDSTCSKKTYTLLAPGSDGGLVTGRYQKQASPPFDSSGNALSHRITKPTRFYGVNFGTATNRVDPQTGKHVTAPQVSVTGTTLSGDLRGFAVSWNKQQFNQGSPKPSGKRPGNTRPVTGTYHATTGNYTLQWTSQIQGGPFDGFTGLWHLTGKFTPSTGLTPAAQSASSAPADSQPAAAAVTGSKRPHALAARRQGARGGSTAAAATVPSLAPSAGATAGGNTADAGTTTARNSGSARWPWVVIAVAAIGTVAAIGGRQARPRRTA